MGPIAIDLKSLLANAWSAVRLRTAAAIGLSRPSTDAMTETNASEANPEAQWQEIERVLGEDLGQIVRVYDCQSQAHRQVNAAVDALHELLVEIDEALNTPAASRVSTDTVKVTKARPVQVLRSAA